MANRTSKSPECGGTGVVVLFTSTKPCPLCAAGKPAEEMNADATAQANACSTFIFTQYDEHGRGTAQSEFRGGIVEFRWVQRTAQRLGLESTLRGRPSKPKRVGDRGKTRTARRSHRHR